jgi:signal transduction histidine kinase
MIPRRHHPPARHPAPSDTVLLRRTALRLGLQAAAIVSVIVIMLTGTAVAVVLTGQHRAATILLSQATARAIDVLDPPAGVWLLAQRPDGTQLATPGIPPGLPDRAALAATAASGVPKAFDLQLHRQEFRIQTERRSDGVTLEAILDLRDNHADRDRLLTAMLISGGIGLALAAAAGAWLGTRATQPLRAALALQRHFVADASHELRTPLTLLSTRAQLLRRRLHSLTADTAVLDPAILDAASRVVTDAARLASILDDLLLATQPATPDARVQVDVINLAREVVEEAQPAADTAGIRITGPTHQPEQPAAAVWGSPIALRRALTALVDNATRHASGHVRVTARPTGHQVALEVADDGPGIDPDLAPRLFHRFVSTQAPGPDGRRHYGIGLALVNEIAAAHGGRVELAHSTQPGAVLRIILPTS